MRRRATSSAAPARPKARGDGSSSSPADELQRLTEDDAAPRQHGASPRFVLRGKDLIERHLDGMIDATAAVMMPAILGAKRTKHAHKAVGAKLLPEEAHVGFRRQRAKQRLVRALDAIRRTAAGIEWRYAIAEELAPSLELCGRPIGSHEQRVHTEWSKAG